MNKQRDNRQIYHDILWRHPRVANLSYNEISQVELAVRSATAAFPGWSALTYEARATYLFRIADLIDER